MTRRVRRQTPFPTQSDGRIGHPRWRLRTRLQQIYAEWLKPFAACIAQAQAAGELATDFKPLDLADFLISSWEGAILRMKVERSAAPLERFKRIAFRTFLAQRDAR